MAVSIERSSLSIPDGTLFQQQRKYFQKGQNETLKIQNSYQANI